MALDALRRHLTKWNAVVSVGSVAIIAVLLALSFNRSRLYTDPELLWRDAVHKRPNNPRALNGLAVAELRKRPHDLREPDTLPSRAVAIDSTYVSAYLSKSAIAINQSRFADAESNVTHVLRVLPGESMATETLGQGFIADGKPTRAIPYLNAIRWSANAEMLTRLGIAYLSSGQLDSAVVALQAALRFDPANVDALQYMGGVLIEQERGGEGVPYLVRAVQRDTTSGFALGMLGLALAQARQPNLAAQADSAGATYPAAIGA